MTQNSPEEIVEIDIRDFFETYLGVMPKDVFSLYIAAKAENKNCLVLRKSVYDNMVFEKSKKMERDFLLSTTASLNNRGIELEKQNKIDEALEVYEENIRLGYPASHSFDRLGVLYRKKGDIENEKRVLRRRYLVYNLPELELEKEMEKIDNKAKGIKPSYILPKTSKKFEVKGLTLGFQFEELIRKLPEFNFYFDKPDNEDTNTYLFRHPDLVNDNIFKPKIWEIQRSFKNLISQAKSFQSNYDLESACNIYEKVIAEQCHLIEPYTNLKQIYVKANLKTDAKRVLSVGIDYFKCLKKRQIEYVLDIAKKYRKLDFAQDRINKGEKIFYYGGAFELYNPYSIINTWEKELEKLG